MDLSNETYQLVTQSVPIVCVDLIPVRENGGGWQIGIITRATGPEAGKPALIGGRILHQELVQDAIARHLKSDTKVTDFQLFANSEASQPFYVQQYLHQSEAKPPLGYDPTKHSIALTYLVDLLEEPKPSNEASDFRWITFDQLPKSAGYNQHLMMNKAFQFLRGLKA